MLNKQAFSGLISLDAYTWFFNLLILIATGLTVLTSVRYLTDDGLDLYEYFVLLLFSAAGMMFMVSGNHILIIFMGLETLVHFHLHTLRDTAGEFKVQRSGTQIYSAGGVFQRHLPVWSGLAVRGRGVSESTGAREVLSSRPDQPDGSRRHGPACWSVLRSRWPPCHFTCGPRTSMRVRRLPSPASCRLVSRPLLLQHLSESSLKR